MGTAVKVTEVPAHIGFAEADILTDAVTSGFTVMVTPFEVAGLPVTQLALEVITQVTIFPFTGTNA